MKHLKKIVKSVPDCRRTGKGSYRHRLEDILLLVILDRLGGYITRPGIIRFGKRNLIIPVFGNTVEQCAVRTYTLPYFQTYWWWSPVWLYVWITSCFHDKLVGFARVSSALTARQWGEQCLKTDAIPISCRGISLLRMPCLSRKPS